MIKQTSTYLKATILANFLLFFSFFSFGQTPLGGTFSSDTTLMLTDSPFEISGGVSISSGTTMTIEPGVEIQFPNTSSAFTVSGSLIAIGTDTDSIKFIGTNSDPTQHGLYVQFSSSATNCEVSHAIFEKLGEQNVGSYQAAIVIQSSGVSIQKSRISDCERYGISCTSEGDRPTIEEVIFYDVATSDANAHPSNLNNFQNNTGTQIQVNGAVNVNDAIWPGNAFNSGGKFNINGSVSVNASASLTIGPGAEVQFPETSSTLNISGTLIANGTDADSIKFIGTNIDPAQHGLYVHFTSTASNCDVSHAVFEKLGEQNVGSYQAAIVIQSSGVSIKKSRISDCEKYGISCTSEGDRPTIEDVIFYDVITSDVNAHPSNLNNFQSNTGTQIQVNGTITVNDAVWPGNAYNGGGKFNINSSVSVNNNASLTIGPGAEIQFPSTSAALTISGTLIANGTDSDSIKFVGTNIDPLQHGLYVHFTSTANNCDVSHAIFEKLGEQNVGSYFSAIVIQSSSVSIKKSRISDSEKYGISCTSEGDKPTIENVLFQNNGSSDANAHPSNLNNFLNNIGTHFNVQGTISDLNAVWPGNAHVNGGKFQIPSSVTITGGNKLTIGAGAEVQFSMPSSSLDVSGTLVALGTDTDSIGFIGTNSDPELHGLYVNFNSSATNCEVSHAIFEKLGEQNVGSFQSSVVINSGEVSIKKSRISDSEQYGIRCISEGDKPTIEDVLFSNIPINDVNAHPSNLNNFLNNIGTSIRVFGTVTDTNAVWPGKAFIDGGKFIIDNSVVVSQNSKLTIGPDGEVHFPNTSSNLEISGTLIAVGTDADSIQFLGTNSDPNQHGLYVNFTQNASNCEVSHAIFEKLGEQNVGSFYSAIIARTSSLSIKKSRISDSEQFGIYCLSEGDKPTVEDVLFINNASSDVNAHASNLVNFANNIGTNIRVSGVVSDPNAVWPGNAHIGGGKFQIFSSVSVNSTSKLTIGAGAEVQFPNTSSNLEISGTLLANGTAADSIQFLGTNSDPNMHGLYVRFNSSASNSEISHAIFEKLGEQNVGSFYSALVLQSEDVSIKKSRITDSEKYGIYCLTEGLRPIVEEVLFTNIPDADVEAHASNLNNFHNNIGIQLKVSGSVSDTSSFWPGDAFANGGKFRLTSTLTINPNSKLTIGEGAEVQFPNTSDNINVNGVLIANGTPSDSIRFIGVNASPDNHGGNVFFNSGPSNSEISYAVFDKMADQSSPYGAAVYINNKDVSIMNCRFQDSETKDIRMNLVNATTNLFNNDANYISVFGNVEDTVSLPNNTLVGKSIFKHDSDWTVEPDAALFIEPGVEIHFPNTSADMFVNGTLVANGTVADSIRFIGIDPSPDNHGGNIFFNTDASNNEINYAVFDKMGDQSSPYDAAVYINSKDVSVMNSRFHDSETKDIRMNLGNATTNLFNNDASYISVFGNVADTVSLPNNTLVGKSIFKHDSDWLIEPDAALFIEPGVEIHFPNTSADITVNGTLVANGTIADSIRFIGTDPSPDNHGGNIFFNTGASNNEINYAVFDKMGDQSSPYDAAVYINNEDVSLMNCRFHDSEIKDIRMNLGNASSNIFNNDATHISVFGNVVDTVTLPQNTLVGKSIFEHDSDWSVETDALLTIEPGVDIYFKWNSDMTIHGTLIAIGTQADSIRFTGTDQVPANHGGVVIFQSTSNNNSIRYAVFEKLGDQNSPNDAALIIQTNDLVFEKSRITNSEQYGLRCLGEGHKPIVQEILFTDNNLADAEFHPSNLVNFHNNQGDYVLLTGSVNDTAAVLPGDAFIDGGRFQLYNTVFVNSNSKLTIGAGSELQFANPSSKIDVSGTLIVNGTAADSVRFIGIAPHPDNHGGAIYLSPASINNEISYAVFDKMGDQNTTQAALNINSSSSSLTNTRFHDSEAEDLIINLQNAPQNIFNNEAAYIYVLGNVEDTVTLPGDALANGAKYRHQSDWNISANGALIVGPGSEIQFPNSSVDFLVSGSLIANGTPTDSIKFVGSDASPDNHGGNIYFEPNSQNNQISYAVLEKLGDQSSIHDAAIRINNAELTFTKSRITDSETRGLRNETTNNGIILEDVLFQNNGDDDIRAHPENVSQYLNNSAAYIELTGDLSSSATFPKNALQNGAKYRLGNTITVDQGANLTIEPGCELQFEQQNHELRIEGSLIADGTPVDSIRFLGVNPSLNTHGAGVLIDELASNSQISYAVFEKLGDQSSQFDAPLKVEIDNFTLQNSRIIDSEGYGLITSSNASPVITNVSIKDVGSFVHYNISGSPTFRNCQLENGTYGARVLAGEPKFIDCTILNNSSWGIENTGNGIVDARNVWWGSDKGPFHDPNNLAGGGNKVSDRVWYNPWLSTNLKHLAINANTLDTIASDTIVYYILEIPDSLNGATLHIQLSSNANTGLNELYGEITEFPSRGAATYTAEPAMSTERELLIYGIPAGTNYVALFPEQTGNQNIEIQVDVLDFQILAVDPPQAGNTGNATLKVNGAHFEPNMSVRLDSAGTTVATANSIEFLSEGEVFTTFNFNGIAPGNYDFIVQNTQGDTSHWIQDFQVIQDGLNPGGNSGNTVAGCSPGSSNDNPLLVNIEAPPFGRPNTTIELTIYFENQGLIDIPTPRRILTSQQNNPLSFEMDGLDGAPSQLLIELKEEGGPTGVLRPGASGTISVYARVSPGNNEFKLLK